MIKQYFTDGLVQIAILLSLLRTDLNHLPNNLINYPEVQDIILGQSVAYVPTNFHNQYNTINSMGYNVHPKNIDNFYSFHSSIFQDIQALYKFRRQDRINVDISAFLVSDPLMTFTSPPLASIADSAASQSQTSSQPSITSDVNNAVNVLSELNDNNNVEVAQENDFLLNEDWDLVNIGGSSPADEDSTEAVAQPSAAFLGSDLSDEDLHLIDVLWRQDLDLGISKEAFDINLRRKLEKECELELQRTREKQRELELCQQRLQEKRRQQEEQWKTQNFEQDGETGEWIPLSSDHQQVNVTPVQPPTDEFNLSAALDVALDIMSSHGPQDLEDEFNIPSTTEVLNGENSSGDQLPANEYPGVMPFSFTGNNSSYMLPVQPLSIEDSWQDLLQYMNSGNSSIAQPQPLNSTNSTTPVSDALAPNLVISNFSLMGELQEPLLSTNLTSLVGLDYNSTSPDSGNSLSPLEWEAPNFEFSNFTELTSQAGLLLPDAEIEKALEEAAVLESMDEASNDSAVSMNSSSPMQCDLGGYEGLEGATGGQDGEDSSPTYTKMSKYNPEDFNYGMSSFTYSASDSCHTNFSSNSNDSSSFGDSSSSPSSTSTGSNHHFHHNHTYTVAPGMTPKEVKKYSDKPKHKGPHSRDERRASELNIPVTMMEIIDTPVEEFNEIISRHKLNDAQLQLIRDIRRRGKNKVAAQNCRKRKMDVIVGMEDHLQSLQDMKDKLLAEKETIASQTREMKEKYRKLYEEIFRSLRDEHGKPYSPSEYSLQQLSDGNVFLVPRNKTPGSVHESRNHDLAGSRKRKNSKK